MSVPLARGSSVHVVLRLPRDARTIGFVRDLAGAALGVVDASEQDIGDVRIAVSEACGNAVEHAVGAADYEVVLDVHPDLIAITVRDQGEGLAEAASVAAMPRPDALRGRGLPIMRAVCDEVDVTARPGAGTTIRLRKLLAPRIHR